jgi:hypothetical protein
MTIYSMCTSYGHQQSIRQCFQVLRRRYCVFTCPSHYNERTHALRRRSSSSSADVQQRNSLLSGPEVSAAAVDGSVDGWKSWEFGSFLTRENRKLKRKNGLTEQEKQEMKIKQQQQETLIDALNPYWEKLPLHQVIKSIEILTEYT